MGHGCTDIIKGMGVPDHQFDRLAIACVIGLCMAASGCRLGFDFPVAADDDTRDASNALDDADRAVDAPGPLADAAPADAASADAAPGFVLIDTLIINVAQTTPITSSAILTAGVTYRLRASGTARIQNASGGAELCDADYYDFSNVPDSLIDSLASIDPGIGVDDPSLHDSTTQPDWGPYNPTHVYEIDFPGTGDVISVVFHDGNHGNNSGALTLDIFGPGGI